MNTKLSLAVLVTILAAVAGAVAPPAHAEERTCRAEEHISRRTCRRRVTRGCFAELGRYRGNHYLSLVGSRLKLAAARATHPLFTSPRSAS